MLTQSDVKEIAETAAREAVKETLLTIGLDVSDPLRAQEGFVVVRRILLDEGFVKDMAHLRKWRLSVEQVETKGIIAAVGVAVSGIAVLIWIGFKTKLGLG